MIERVREIAGGVARAYVARREELGFPLSTAGNGQ